MRVRSSSPNCDVADEARRTRQENRGIPDRRHSVPAGQWPVGRSGLTRACKCMEGCIEERVRDLRAGQSKRANPPLAPMLEREKLFWPSLANGNKPTLQGEGARFGKGGAAKENLQDQTANCSQRQGCL
jgi:hypothetical protein